jgi:hypothetical protein
MGWLWILFMVLMGAIPIALVILAVVMIPRRRKSENADSHVEWWTPHLMCPRQGTTGA